MNEKMRQFVLSYTGDSATAMQAAGYVGTRSELERKGNELLKTPVVAEAIKERSRYLASSVRMIAQTEEIQGFWSDVMRNSDPYAKPEVDANGCTKPEGNIPLPTRLKSAELLAKSQGMFIERIDVRSQVSFVEIVQDAYSISDTELARIEIEYERNRTKKIEAEKMKADIEADSTEIIPGSIDELF